MGGPVHHLLARLRIGDSLLSQLQAKALTVSRGVRLRCRRSFPFFRCGMMAAFDFSSAPVVPETRGKFQKRSSGT